MTAWTKAWWVLVALWAAVHVFDSWALLGWAFMATMILGLAHICQGIGAS